MHHLWIIGYHDVDYGNISPLNLDFKTSGNICPMIFWFVDASIHYIMIMPSFPKDIWCVIWFTLSIVRVAHCISSWQCDTHEFRLTGRNLLPHMVSASVFFLFFYSLIFFNASKIQIINMIQPTPHVLYPHMTPQTHKCFIIYGHLISNV